nr:zinc finger and SCAN domain-containing protein 2-like [Aedes albopictus]
MSLKIDISVCRVCCTSDASHSILKYAQKFHYCTAIEVAENDGLPDKICQTCLDRMKIAVEFKKKSEFSDRQLKSFISNVNNQFLALGGSSSAAAKLDEDEEAAEPPKVAMVVIPSEDSDVIERKLVCEKSAEPEPEPKASVEADPLPSAASESEPEPPPEQEPEKFRAVAVIQEKPPVIKPERELYEVVELEYEDTYVQEEEEEPEEVEEHVEMEVEEHQPERQQPASESGDSSEQVIYIGFTSDFPDQEEDEGEGVTHSESQGDGSDRQVQFSHVASKPKTANVITFHQQDSVDNKWPEASKFECVECSKSFSTKTNLNRHVQTHNGNKPFVCPLCSKGFTQGGSLKQHLLIHQNLRPYVCTACGQAFTQAKSLTFHMRRHTNEKPFVCPHCSYAFRQKDGLKRHLMVKHTETDARQFDCDQCGKAFKTRYALSMHRKRHDNGMLTATVRER